MPPYMVWAWMLPAPTVASAAAAHASSLLARMR